jgi:hypothetical protein
MLGTFDPVDAVSGIDAAPVLTPLVITSLFGTSTVFVDATGIPTVLRISATYPTVFADVPFIYPDREGGLRSQRANGRVYVDAERVMKT